MAAGGAWEKGMAGGKVDHKTARTTKGPAGGRPVSGYPGKSSMGGSTSKRGSVKPTKMAGSR